MRQHNPNVYFDILKLHLGCTVPHILIDLLLLGFPVPLIWRLHMHRSQKIILTFIFTLGSLYVALCCFSSIATLSALELKQGLRTDDYSESSVTAVSIVRMTIVIGVGSGFSLENYFITYYLWTSVEVNISIICGQYMKICCSCSCGRTS